MRDYAHSQKLQEEIFQEAGYETLQKDDECFRYKVLKGHKQKMLTTEGKSVEEEVYLVCYWSEKMAKRDKAERERLLKKAENALENGIPANDKKGYRRYIQQAGKKEAIGIDIEQIEKDANYDGYYVIQTSKKELTAQEVFTAYKQLWQIEESFKIMKSTLWTRPIFHWTPKRIQGHFVICFIALLLERTLEQKLKNNHIEASPQKIQAALNTLQVSHVRISEKEYYLKGKIAPLAAKILRAMRIKQPENLTPKNEFKL